MATATLSFVLFTFKPASQPAPDSPPDSFSTICSPLLAAPGLISLQVGLLMEDAPTWVLLSRWESPAALDTWQESDPFDVFIEGLHTVSEDVVPEQAEVAGDVTAVLSAPCVEIFYALEAEHVFLKERLPAFARGLQGEGMKGFHGLCYGKLDVGAGKESAVMLLGWDSKEAHLAQRGDGKPIDRHIHLVREGRDRNHINLKTVGVVGSTS
ncbi:hypothetical protein CDD80_283 [Ophiocordyceps camponoti-rufipedis]|uniref:ABM domain-containing protein n=1 Tax=Ophiocordyceps camponoti-rufipedis TaxID=2004952 RepID=A0A2C5ZEW1_9HYPO|nr:hypothetical protein CDD80_283 [Ophiocordyceps camponoti-rufipedis]